MNHPKAPWAAAAMLLALAARAAVGAEPAGPPAAPPAQAPGDATAAPKDPAPASKEPAPAPKESADAAKEPAAQPPAATDAAPVTPEEVQRLVASLATGDDAQRTAARKRLSEAGQAAVAPLVEMLADAQAPPARRAAAAEALVAVGRSSQSALVDALGHADPFVRASAAAALGQTRMVECVPAVMRCLGDREAAVREGAAKALGHLGDAGAADGLARIFRKDASAEVRTAAVEALGRLACRAAIEPLVEGLSDPELAVRRVSATGLAGMGTTLAAGRRGELGRRRAAAALVAALADKDALVRTRATEALGLMKEKEAVDAIGALLDDADARLAAVQALARIKTPQSQRVLTEAAAHHADATVREAAGKALRTMGNP